MIAVQEELDWEVYRLYGLIDEDLTYGGDDLPGLALGERAFEIALARAVGRRGGDGVVHPARVHADHRDPGRTGRLDTASSCSGGLSSSPTDPSIRLLEKPEYKRRWAQEPWEKRQERALRDWLLDRLEDRRFWFDAQGRRAAQRRPAGRRCDARRGHGLGARAVGGPSRMFR